jgi:uncharacterized membrane protein
MKKDRLLAFSDGVLAIIITILVLGISNPAGYKMQDLLSLVPNIVSYILSFVYIGLYWNNHHHMWQVANKVNGKILWANLNLLFWISLMPIATNWMGEYPDQSYPVAFFGFILLLSSIAWFILAHLVKKEEGENSLIYQAYKNDKKTFLSMTAYLVGILLSFIMPILSVLIYWLVAMYWFIPDKRIEKKLI